MTSASPSGWRRRRANRCWSSSTLHCYVGAASSIMAHATTTDSGVTSVQEADCGMLAKALAMTLTVFFIPSGSRDAKWCAHMHAWIRTTGLMGQQR